MNRFAIAIDGPAGSGKSTVAKALAKALDIIYIDTGAMYRAVALYCMRLGISTKEEAAVCSVLDRVHIGIRQEDGAQHIYLNGEDVTAEIRTPEAGQGASDVGAFWPVREKLITLQQALARESSVVMDGRDIGTCVLPRAEVKIYLVADPTERARRRLAEYAAKGEAADLETVRAQIVARDENDRNRVHNPLKKAEDAVEVDTTSLTIGEVVTAILKIVKQTLNIEVKL